MDRPSAQYSVVPPAIHPLLKQSFPFSQLDEEALANLATRCAAAAFPKGTLILKQGSTEIEHLYLIQTGGVRISIVTEDRQVTIRDYTGEGESFGGSSIVQGRKAEFDVEAIKDTFCVLIPKDVFLGLLKTNPHLAEHYNGTVSESMMGAVYAEQQTSRVGFRSAQSRELFNTRIWDLVREPPEIVEGATSVREVGILMAGRGIGSVLVRDASGAVVGMVRNEELKTRVVAAGLDYGTPVERIMVSPVRTLPVAAFCFDALMTMVREKMDHIAVRRRDEIVGVINANDMMVYLGSAPLYLFREIAEQRSVAGLAELARKTPFLVRGLIESGARAAAITQMLTVFTDSLLAQIIALAQQEVGTPPCSFCWLGLGSEGRREQTFRTDQDNALMFEPPLDAKQRALQQEYFHVFASKVATDLEQTGHPKCRNDFMASNKRWRQDTAAWKRCFDEWIRNPMPPDIFLSTIFFDFRPVAGDFSLAEELRGYMLARAQRFPQFLKYFVRYFLLNEPPVSFFADSVVEKDDAKLPTLDLKTRTLTPFVEFARIMALQHGIAETNTLARVKALASKGRIPFDLYADVSQAYEFDLHLKLVHQLTDVEAGRKSETIVRPADLSDLEKRTLKFSFSVIERMMAVVRKEFLGRDERPVGRTTVRGFVEDQNG
jgi:CBS domain-containing protein